jgi:hypothetical protein
VIDKYAYLRECLVAMPTEQVDDALVVELGRAVVREVAPQELPLYRANSAAYVKNPTAALRGATSGDQMLGFGAGIEVTLLTPVVLAVLSEVVKFLATEVLQASKRQGSGIIDEQVKRLFKQFRSADPATGGPTTPPPLSTAQLARVRTVAFDTARRLQLSADQAQLLADSTVGGLASA